eukprot:6477434-Amphidinium_carterae.2
MHCMPRHLLFKEANSRVAESVACISCHILASCMRRFSRLMQLQTCCFSIYLLCEDVTGMCVHDVIDKARCPQ